MLSDPDVRVRDHAYHVFPRGKLGRAVRTERYRLVEWRSTGKSNEDAEYELYDYKTDPLETVNKVSSQPGVASQLKAILDRYPAPVPPRNEQH